MMKHILCSSIIILYFASLVDCTPAKKPQTYSEVCAQESGVDFQVINDAEKLSKVPPPSDAMYAYYECYAKGSNRVSENGVLNYAMIKKGFIGLFGENDAALASDMFDTCLIEKQASLGETYYLLKKCILEQVKKSGSKMARKS